ncbi:hypothetical protein VOLCADRAFT_98032 [Volvox carteri f. nagariensis]|uniref:Uncharacterized protein n=1 Tax=Volvox carteri f. nagariensis TaxID=3068 RepID=D8UE97_VOLCA|nr:uncharacterized protein VOLCADRAFT_98032 [Volvox carteri f. nagariensis]EFJ41966.1 hypothetical protein VOLCADRAFT_98032 [Volvox carteri f. nagariensis]|eukprot:XP_002957003.1 hypothetical protein VOLCADRAFT_98032 [Volvox carteri f. nagariensis]
MKTVSLSWLLWIKRYKRRCRNVAAPYGQVTTSQWLSGPRRACLAKAMVTHAHAQVVLCLNSASVSRGRVIGAVVFRSNKHIGLEDTTWLTVDVAQSKQDLEWIAVISTSYTAKCARKLRRLLVFPLDPRASCQREPPNRKSPTGALSVKDQGESSDGRMCKNCQVQKYLVHIAVMQRNSTPEYLKLASVSSRQCTLASWLQPSAIMLLVLRTRSKSPFTSPAGQW